jgi:CDGSH-type Zn-finger protein
MATTRLTINSNGSTKIEGDFEIVDRDGNVYNLAGRTVVSLCRCGRSQNKPFCDGSHKGHFEHEAKAFALPPRKEI